MSTLGDIPTYVTLPVTDYDETKAVLFLSDIFGFYVNSKVSLAFKTFRSRKSDLLF